MLRSARVGFWTVAPLLLIACVALAEEKPKPQLPPTVPPKADKTSAPVQPKLPAAGVETPKLQTGQAAIERALDAPTQLEFVDAPLVDVIDYLKDYHGIAIVLDVKALEDVGIDADESVTVNLKGVSLRSALNQMLRPLDLAWTVHDEVLLITTTEAEENMLCTKVYDVSDLVVCRDQHDRLWDDYDTLVEAITSTISPITWDCVGGVGSITGASLGKAKVLVVRQTYKVHGELAELLATLREMAKKNPDAELPRRSFEGDKTDIRGTGDRFSQLRHCTPATPSRQQAAGQGMF